MPDIQIITLDKVSKPLSINTDGNLGITLSEDPQNMLKLDPENNLIVKGVFVETVPNANSIAWTGVNIPDPNILTGMADGSNPLQVGKDILGNIWLRGAVTNIGGAVSANTIIGTIPGDYEISGYADDYNFFQLTAVQSSLAGNTAAIFLRLQNYNYMQSLAFSANLATNVSFIIQPMIIGKARYVFKGTTTENMPSYMNVSWENIQITNASVVSGLSDGSNALQIGKDDLGNVWMQGAVTNNGAAISANGVIGTFPVSCHLAGYASANTFCQLTAIQSTLAGHTAALFLRFKNYNDVQSFAFSASFASGVSFQLQPTIIGRAKN